MCLHLQTYHSNAANQWINAWRPRKHTREIGLILEDDVDISPFALHWLVYTQQTFQDDPRVFGYSLQSQDVRFPLAPYDLAKGSAHRPIYMLPIIGTIGFSPKTRMWRSFQNWYAAKRRSKKNFIPHVPGTMDDVWYSRLKILHTEDSMAHELWILHYMWLFTPKLLCVYNNLATYTSKLVGVYLANHRKEQGLHHDKKTKTDLSEKLLLNHWNASFLNFNKNITATLPPVRYLDWPTVIWPT